MRLSPLVGQCRWKTLLLSAPTVVWDSVVLCHTSECDCGIYHVSQCRMDSVTLTTLCSDECHRCKMNSVTRTTLSSDECHRCRMDSVTLIKVCYVYYVCDECHHHRITCDTNYSKY